ncbi:ATP-binding cassette domain-containing protein [Gloeobacter morelensis]|uniref:ATP-binding cassette domain-containing protein n=1 Tax=Gloeobacter morelensis MG652769 TaxID=2781736 RepID=A0ABY3PSL1_9CYAN|nr:ATP-binding cassette domain-containing protein [Gloeobacter morelensis]UFP96725.1 ATP-binding cassette domain-containing protein [Gloeobacter morelensis MG652769]
MISLQAVSKRYGTAIALAPTSIACEAGSTTALIGPSGCGKSTLLRIIAGLVVPDSGTVTLAGETLTARNSEKLRRRLGYVIQDGGLFPHLNCRDNVTLLARYLKQAPAAINQRVAELAALVQIPAAALARFPRELSGGQRQRIGLMRALMNDPPIVLLDEPLGALDPITRSELQTQLKTIFAGLGRTVILVTHDMGEAAYLASSIALMRDGRIVQRGSLQTLLEAPAEAYVSEFIRAQRSPLPSL